MFGKDIIKPQTAQEMVTAFEESKREITEAYLILANAEKRLHAAFGPYSGYASFDTVKRDIWWNNTKPLETVDKIIAEIHRGAWQRIVERLEIKKLMSIKRAKELSDLLEKGELPELTEEGIYDLLMKFRDDAENIQQELVEEVFKLLRPAAFYNKEYKTNDKFEIGKKVILSWMVEQLYNGKGYRVSYYHTDELNALDRVFHLLDGASIPDGYHSPLVDAINTTDPDGKGKTDYFKFQSYKNHNLHITFLRPDLVKKLNQLGGGNDLPGKTTQATQDRKTKQEAMF